MYAVASRMFLQQVSNHSDRTQQKGPENTTFSRPSEFCGGEEEDRTPDLCIANAALSQLSYPPTPRIEDLRLHQTVGDEVCLNFSKKARGRLKKVCLRHG